MQIRDAVQADFDEITAIYNEVLTNSTAIYNDRPATVADRIAWWRARIEQQYPVLVVTDDENMSAASAATVISAHGRATATPSRAPSTSHPDCAEKASAQSCSTHSSRWRGKPASTP